MDQLRNKILEVAKELYPDDFEAVAALISPAVGLQIIDGTPLPGKSKFGGNPDVGASFVWPKSEGKPLMFLCQINLNDISRQRMLPPEGMLYFFISAESQEQTSLASSQFTVIYDNDLGGLAAIQSPQPASIPAAPIAFFKHYTTPSYQERIMLEKGFDINDLRESVNEITTGNSWDPHHLLGDPDAVQGAVRLFWASRLLNPDDIFYEKLEANLERFYRVGDEFVLLLQINLEDKAVLLPGYGDSCLYFGILNSDLERRNFDNVQLVIQGT